MKCYKCVQLPSSVLYDGNLIDSLSAGLKFSLSFLCLLSLFFIIGGGGNNEAYESSSDEDENILFWIIFLLVVYSASECKSLVYSAVHDFENIVRAFKKSSKNKKIKKSCYFLSICFV